MQVAEELGADCSIQVKPNEGDEKVVKCIEETLGSLPDITIDCSGFESTIKQGLKVKHKLQENLGYSQ